MKFSIKTISFLAMLFLALLYLGAMLGLLLASARQGQALETASHCTAAVAQIAQLERSLLAYQRLANLSLSTQERGLLPEKMRLWSEVLRQLHAMRSPVTAALDARQLEDVVTAVKHYHQQRTALEEQRLPLGQVLRLTGQPLSSALERITLLRHQQEAKIQQEQATARSYNRLAITVGLAALLLVCLGLASIIFIVRRHILRPVLELPCIMRRFRQGDRQARAGSYAAVETDAIARTFNQMADTIEGQRQLRLAFMAGVAHDLRNPLMVLSTGLQLLQQNLPPQRKADLYVRLERQLGRLERMAGDLLDSAHIEAGKLALRQESLELRQLTQEVINLFRLSSSTNSLILRQPDEPLWVSADPDRLEQVLENLLSNAIKYSAVGAPVEITLRPQGAEAELCVTDHGPGIDPEALEDIFLPFYRRASTSKSAAGSGIGLSIVKGIVTAHGGRIAAKSTDSGSTFCVWLPLHPSEAGPAPADQDRG